MVRKVTKRWVSSKDQKTMELTFQHIGTKWSLEEREKVLRTISYAFFPPNRRNDVWSGYDQTHQTVNNEPYYPITVSLNQTLNRWFKNLRLLQVRQKLNLVRNLRVNLGQQSSTVSNVYSTY